MRYLATRDFFNDAFADFFKPIRFSYDGMRTDIKELDDGYEMNIEMPGFDKSQIDIELKDSYLHITAKKEEKEEDTDKYIFRERKAHYSRSYYVGDTREDGITAKYDNGILTVNIAKQGEQKSKILIE
ncbi:MAG: Hsp20/alpha crystallin family protein [Clostridiales bacterium]|nr:Hsp20/alpha crystallin family protein [Clostridiales bacterium]